MADAQTIRSTIERYLALFSTSERDPWLDLFADGATMEDPVGSPLRTGREAIGAFFDESHAAADSVELRAVGAAIVCGDEASFAFQARPSIGGQTLSMPVIDVMTFDETGRITTQRAFVDYALLAPG